MINSTKNFNVGDTVYADFTAYVRTDIRTGIVTPMIMTIPISGRRSPIIAIGKLPLLTRKAKLFGAKIGTARVKRSPSVRSFLTFSSIAIFVIALGIAVNVTKSHSKQLRANGHKCLAIHSPDTCNADTN
jgi:hypothetical protein